jgi:hypothetical protein
VNYELAFLRVMLYVVAVVSALLIIAAVVQEPGIGTLGRAVQMVGTPLTIALAGLAISPRKSGPP